MVRVSAIPKPTLDHEQEWWQTGSRLVAGVDEVGRGALAGPLLAAAVILPADLRETAGLAGLAESKLQSAQQREAWLPVIHEIALAVGVGVVECDELDMLGVGPANRIAMERAVLALKLQPDALLIDAALIESALPQVGIIDGDARCLSIAAASIVAKVTRDRLMVDWHTEFEHYGFAVHKGYGTAAHLSALRQHGPCRIHRRCFRPVAEAVLV